MTSSVKSRPKFRVIEGGSQSEHNDIYEDFKADYLSPNITKKEVLKKYGMNDNSYTHLKNRVAEETGVNRKMSKNKYTRMWTHYSRFIDHMKKSDKYRVSKVIMGKKTHFGLYDDMKTAVMVRDRLEKDNWSQKTYKQIRHELFDEPLEEPVKAEEIYDDFKKDYLNGESVKYIRTKYHIGLGTYNVISKKVRSEMGIIRKPQLSYREMKRHERDLYRQQRMSNLL